MCELLVRARDKPLTGNIATDSGRYRRGDVIVCVPDGWAWSAEERNHPRWVILKVPGMPLSEGQALATHEPRGQPKKRRGRMRRHFHKRYFSLDMDALVGEYDGRAKGEVVLTAQQIRAARSSKAPIEER